MWCNGQSFVASAAAIISPTHSSIQSCTAPRTSSVLLLIISNRPYNASPTGQYELYQQFIFHFKSSIFIAKDRMYDTNTGEQIVTLRVHVSPPPSFGIRSERNDELIIPLPTDVTAQPHRPVLEHRRGISSQQRPAQPWTWARTTEESSHGRTCIPRYSGHPPGRKGKVRTGRPQANQICQSRFDARHGRDVFHLLRVAVCRRHGRSNPRP
mmetsp:Transcript_6221/g.12952  ORF Transcript_6221/g.12952 Transcript_6221/m.12952 type:complete len:211 (+) Transcript_6221:20-652(+)